MYHHSPLPQQTPAFFLLPALSPDDHCSRVATLAPGVFALAPAPAGAPPPYSSTRPELPRIQTRSRTLPSARRGSPPRMSMSAPSSSPPPYSPAPPEFVAASASTRRTASSPHLRQRSYSSPWAARVLSDDDSADETAQSEDDILYTGSGLARRSVGAGLGLAGALRARLLGNSKTCIGNGGEAAGAGETETEGEGESEDPLRNPRRARAKRDNGHESTYAALAALMPALVSFSRLLAIVPAAFGTLYNLARMLGFDPGSILGNTADGAGPAVWWCEWLVAALWAILTGWQCLCLTTGLLKRWRVYYSPLPTLIRLFALQAICWPATHLTLSFLEHDKRPLLCWAVVGTTTCCSRSIQLWVTSNIGSAPAPHGRYSSHLHPHSTTSHTPLRAMSPPPMSPISALASALGNAISGDTDAPEGELRRLSRRRHWDWAKVVRTCALPAGILYFVTAWAEMIRREVGAGC